MKRIFTASLVGILTCLVLITSMVTVFADTTAASVSGATINGVSAPVGSSVEYTLFLESYQQEVVGIQMIFKYDVKMLELKDVKLDSFPGATLNANNGGDGMIYFNNSDINGIDFSKPKEVAKLTFNVIGEGSSDIEYLIQYLYDIDLVNIYDYTLTYSLSVDGTQQIATETPVLADVDKIVSEVSGGFDKGDFANNVEGTGSGIKPVVTTVAAASNSTNNNTDNGGSGNNTALYVIGGVVVVALIAVIIVVATKKKNS